MRSFTRALLASLVILLATTANTTAASAQSDEEPDNIVVITGRAEVRAGETVDNVFIADGPVVIDGTVRDALVALNGDVTVSGTVQEDVIVVDGRVTIADGGRVQGDVMSRHPPVVEGNGRLDGSWERWSPRAWTGARSVVGWLALWLAFTISTLVLGLILGLLAPRAASAVDDAAHATGPVILWGLVLVIGLPIIAILAMVTLVGLPLGLALLLALALIYGIGYTAGAWIIGRRVVRNASPIVAFVVGWGILRVFALVPFLGGLAWLVAVVGGLGAILAAVRRARRHEVVTVDPGPPAAAAPPAQTAS